MKFKFLGASDANPNNGNGQSGIILYTGNTNYLFDCGDGIATKIWCDGDTNLNNIQAIFISHLDPDHTGGVFSLMHLFHQHIKDLPLQERNKNIIKFFIPSKEATCYIEKLMPLMRMDDKNTAYKKVVVPYEGTKIIYSDDNIIVSSFPTYHKTESHGFIINAEGKKIVYTADIKNPYVIQDYTLDSDLTIIECAHFKTEEITDALMDKKIRNLIVNHINKERYDDPLKLMDDLKPLLKSTNVFIAKDGMKFKL